MVEWAGDKGVADDVAVGLLWRLEEDGTSFLHSVLKLLVGGTGWTQLSDDLSRGGEVCSAPYACEAGAGEHVTIPVLCGCGVGAGEKGTVPVLCGCKVVVVYALLVRTCSALRAL